MDKKDKLDIADPPGWYLCSIYDITHVLHWDGHELDDCLPHIRTQSTSEYHAKAKSFQGPMVIVDVEF